MTARFLPVGVLVAAALACAAATTRSQVGGAKPTEAPTPAALALPARTAAPFQARNLGSDPPEVLSGSVQLLRQPTDAGNAVLRVRFAPNQGLPDQIVVTPGDRRAVLRDDGKGGDAKAGDGEYTATIQLDVKALDAQQGRAAAAASNAPAARPVFLNRSKLGDVRQLVNLDIEKLRGFNPVPLPVPLPLGNPANIDAKRSLMITDVKVVEDPTRTFNPCANSGTPMGKWTFGYLMTQMANTPATGVPADQFVRRWLRRWELDQTVNDWPVGQRLTIKTQVIDPWLAASGPGDTLDLAKAPFKLLAIVNRIDLHENLVYGGGSAGEARFVFCAVTPNCTPLQFTVIFEYGVKKQGCSGLKNWAQQWANLGTLPLGSPAYNAALEAITEQYAAAGADPAKPNGSALNQLRTDEIALGNPWQLREFQLFATDTDAHHLREVTVKQTPDNSLNQTDRMVDYVNANAADIVAQRYAVPADFPAGSPFLGGSSQTDTPGFFWNRGPAGKTITNPEARREFSLGTCNGCHGGETNTFFTHVKPAAFGTEAALSQFLTGLPNFPDPAGVAGPRSYADLEHRAAVLDELANGPCFLQVFRRPLRMTH